MKEEPLCLGSETELVEELKAEKSSWHGKALSQWSHAVYGKAVRETQPPQMR